MDQADDMRHKMAHHIHPRRIMGNDGCVDVQIYDAFEMGMIE
jgi:hypothetical protein